MTSHQAEIDQAVAEHGEKDLGKEVETSPSHAEKATRSFMSHTPGPWEPKYGYVFAGKNCIAICDTDNAWAERYDANANLIAAAPDLLSALKSLTECVEAGPDGANLDWWLIQARDAISKATGETP